MKIVYVKDSNALEFDKQNKENIVFAKYFSPGCPACIAMESEWDDMCKDIDEKYNTDLILAQIDPTGMSKLEKTDTYSDVDYVPSIVVLQNGKKIAEYDGPKNKDNMIEFLLKGKYLNDKMKGGRGSKTIKRRKNTRKKSKNTRRKRKNTRRNRKGSGTSMSTASMSASSIQKTNKNKKINVVNRDKDDFNFVENEKWLKPFLITLNNHFDNNHTITYIETQDFAIRSVDKVFRPKGFTTTSAHEYHVDWMECPGNEYTEFNCRESPGFGNRQVPSSRKFNPKYKNLKVSDVRLKNELKLAKESYDYIKNMSAIDIMLKTPSSDYTRFSSDIDKNDIKNRNFIIKLREIQSNQNKKDPYRAILEAYGYNKPVSIDELKQTQYETTKLMDETHNMIDERLSKESISGGKKSRRKKRINKRIKRKMSRK